MDKSEISKVVVLSNSTEVNAYLDLGWKLIETYTTCYDTSAPLYKHQTLYFVMGWYGDNPKYPAKPEPYAGIIEF